MPAEYAICLIRKNENNRLISEYERFEDPISITPTVGRIIDQQDVLALAVTRNADDIDEVREGLSEEGWCFESIDNWILISRPKMSALEEEVVISLIKRDWGIETERKNSHMCIETLSPNLDPKKGTERGDQMGKKKPKKSKKEKGGDKVVFGKSEKEKIEKEVKELIDVAGIEFVAVIDDRGDALISAGKHEGIDQAQLLAQTSIIYGTSEKGGINLKKGAVIEINVTWKEGVSVLETLSKGYTLHVIASKEEKMAWFRPAIMATTRAIQEIIGS